MFMPIPDTVITVDGTALPIVARHAPWYNQAIVFETVPPRFRVEGDLVAILDDTEESQYHFYYWFLNRDAGLENATWELKPLAKELDTYELAFRLTDSGPGWNGVTFNLPSFQTIESIVATHDSGIPEADGLGTSDTENDIASWPEGVGNFGRMEIGYTNKSLLDQTIYYNAAVYMDPNYKIIVTIRKNPFLKYPNL